MEQSDSGQRPQSYSMWDRILLSLIVLTAAYGLAMVAAGTLVGDQLFDRLGFGPDNGGLRGESQRSYVRFIFGVLGSVIVGWMTLLGFITAGPFQCSCWAQPPSSAAATVWPMKVPKQRAAMR